MRRIIAFTSLVILAAFSVAAIAAAPAGAFPVFFQPWSAAIDANASSTIAIAAKAALANPTLSVIVTGSTDTAGGATANKDLGLTRAQVVADALSHDGVPADRIAVVSAGSVPAPGMDAGSLAQFSRRVLIRIGD
jgi:outer membrane protein OmpA-like peptidoglycan-associated protein